MYERSCVNVKVERVSTFTFTRDLPHAASILFTQIKVTQDVSFGSAGAGSRKSLEVNELAVVNLSFESLFQWIVFNS